MDEKCWELASRAVGETYSRQAREAGSVLTGKIRVLLEQGKLPDEGWEEGYTQSLFSLLAHE